MSSDGLHAWSTTWPSSARRIDGQPSRLDVRAAGSIVHDLYAGAERMFVRIATSVDGEVPTGSGWHASLLRRMTYALPDVRPAVLSADVANSLRPYLRFRHLVRNIYGDELDWPSMSALVERLPETQVALDAQIRGFVTWLRGLAAQT